MRFGMADSIYTSKVRELHYVYCHTSESDEGRSGERGTGGSREQVPAHYNGPHAHVFSCFTKNVAENINKRFHRCRPRPMPNDGLEYDVPTARSGV